MIESASGATFATQKQESPDAKVSCLSKEYMYAIMQISLLLGKSEFINLSLMFHVKQTKMKSPSEFRRGISVYWTNICRKLSFYYRCDTS